MEQITIKVRGVEMTLDEARELWRQLDAVFGPRVTLPVLPAAPASPSVPWPSTTPWCPPVGPYIGTTGDPLPQRYEITCDGMSGTITPSLRQ